MTKERARRIITKLIAHEKGARRIGNKAEAQNYRHKINELMKTHGFTRKDFDARKRARRTQVPEPVEVEGVLVSVRCSCGMRLKVLADLMSSRNYLATGEVLLHKMLGHTIKFKF